MVAYGPFHMFIRLHMKDEYSANLDLSKRKLEEMKTATDSSAEATENLEKKISKQEARMLRAQLTLAVFGATMLSHGLITLGVIDKHSKFGEILEKSVAIIQMVSGAMAILSLVKDVEFHQTIRNTGAKISEAVAHWANAAGITAEMVALTVGAAAAAIAAGLAIGLGAMKAQEAGWFQTRPGEWKRVPYDMPAMVHKGEVITTPPITIPKSEVAKSSVISHKKDGDVYATFNIYDSNNPFQTARETTIELEKLKRRGR